MLAVRSRVAVEPHPKTGRPLPRPSADGVPGLVHLGQCSGFGLVIRLLLWSCRNSHE